ncbi:uncharacterized protein ARMOST_02761 [Armillaria ostoyae]|uniref:Uncharacterized protein n=1 Tax=Armillaria ostoyae TaxID=47428 RepID=A0A284QSK9_ARMOS|nr:uncharacterized protein ARMOST_02761 [Armillaria ostoyae]
MGNPRANNDNKVSRLSAGGRTSTEATKGSRMPSSLNVFWDAATAGGFVFFLMYTLRKNAMHETNGIDFALHKGPRTFLLRDILPNIRRYLVPLLVLRINYHVTGHKFHRLRDSSTSMFISDFRRLETRYRFRPSPATITATDMPLSHETSALQLYATFLAINVCVFRIPSLESFARTLFGKPFDHSCCERDRRAYPRYAVQAMHIWLLETIDMDFHDEFLTTMFRTTMDFVLYGSVFNDISLDDTFRHGDPMRSYDIRPPARSFPMTSGKRVTPSLVTHFTYTREQRALSLILFGLGLVSFCSARNTKSGLGLVGNGDWRNKSDVWRSIVKPSLPLFTFNTSWGYPLESLLHSHQSSLRLPPLTLYASRLRAHAQFAQKSVETIMCTGNGRTINVNIGPLAMLMKETRPCWLSQAL